MPFIYLIIFIIAIIGGIEFLRERKPVPKKRSKRKEYPLDRHANNPLLSPHVYNNWETECSFNPAVIQDDDGKIHLLYRAIGGDGQSRIGYANSNDGITFAERSPYPVYEPMRLSSAYADTRTYDPIMYPSGGSWGGYEDPRAVVIDGTVYMTYIDFGGWNSIRIALTSIALEDLKKKKWNWKRPVFISPEGERHKNWVLFPEKINGKYAIFHGIAPNEMYVDYVEDLSLPFTIHSPRGEGPQKGRENFWDNKMRGAGPPPVKTKDGWLLLYHALDNEEPHKYKLGAMLLDLKNPKKVLYRSPEPILTPDMSYENDGKPGIVYASGATVIKGKLYVYYGGGDKHVCLAQTPLNALLDWLVLYGKV